MAELFEEVSMVRGVKVDVSEGGVFGHGVDCAGPFRWSLNGYLRGIAYVIAAMRTRHASELSVVSTVYAWGRASFLPGFLLRPSLLP